MTPPKPKEEGKVYLIAELDIRVHESWINLINWCQQNAPYADIELRIVNGQPTDLLSCKPKVRFDKQASLPNGIPVKL